MNKKRLFIIIVVILICVSVVAGTVWYRTVRSKESVVGPLGQNEAASKPQTALTTWEDPAGFTFQYPRGLSVNKHDEDEENYAHVELTDSAHPGNVIVWAKDTTAADVTAWVKTEKNFSGASSFDTTLGKQPAKKILLVSPTKKMIVGVVYDELLFMVEASLGDDTYWSDTAQTVIDSFAFIPLEEYESQGDTAGEAGGTQSVDEEEVLE